jgi:hypothetical protein
MRRVLAGLVLGSLLIGTARPAGAFDPVEDALIGMGALFANTAYVPAKMVTAGVGMVAGGLVGFATGGDERASYGVMVPLTTGTFILRTAHFTGQQPIEFFGSDYADRASRRDRENEGSAIYDSQYGGR